MDNEDWEYNEYGGGPGVNVIKNFFNSSLFSGQISPSRCPWKPFLAISNVLR
jgi:hypothetical protein